jgi:hypothetical protein
MEKIIRNDWQQIEKGHLRADILNRTIHPEGLDISRLYFEQPGETELSPIDGHIVTILSGEVLLSVNSCEKPLHIGPSVHLYIPHDAHAQLKISADTKLIHVSGPKEQARGKNLIVRDEQFLRATADSGSLYRWILTPQYLSRRVFLYHDQALLSKNGYPVSWFHTTMFDVNGLPVNNEGLSVFKMSYDNQTEVNVCFDVSGEAKVRMAYHPYSDESQKWCEWQLLDSNTTYYLNEESNGSEVEWHLDPETKEQFSRRNKHEVFIPEGGHVSLCCLFDPAPTGTERHLPGKYSSYEHISKIIGTEAYDRHLKALTPYDEMVDELSLQKARMTLDESNKNPLWQRYQHGLKNQMNLESKLMQQLQEDKQGRDAVVLKWINK